MRPSLLFFVAAVAVTLGLPSQVLAQTPRKVRFEYARQEGAAACPDLATVQAGVAARLGYEPFDERAGELVRATIHPFGHGFEARIEMLDVQGSLKAERRLASHQRDCAELASSVELAVSIAIDPFRLPSAPTPVGLDKAADGMPEQRVPGNGGLEMVPASSGAHATLKVTEPAQPGRRISGMGNVGLVGALGAAPSSSLGVAAGVGLRSGDLSLGLEGRADLPASASLRVGEASTALLIGSLVPCAHSSVVAACALVTAGALRASGQGLVDSRRVTFAYVALGARLALDLPLSPRLSLSLHGDLAAPLGKIRLQVDGDTVWTSPILSVALGVGMTATFP